MRVLKSNNVYTTDDAVVELESEGLVYHDVQSVCNNIVFGTSLLLW